MIDAKGIFDEINGAMVLVCPPGLDTSALIHIANSVLHDNIKTISARPEYVENLWSWLENKQVKIIAELDVGADIDISELSGRIHQSFKKGASAAQIIIPFNKITSFVSDLLPIRADLFFKHELILGFNMAEIRAVEIQNIFINLKKINANGVYFNFWDVDSSDFVGHIYNLFNNFSFSGCVYFDLGPDFQKIEQVYRLCQKICPEIAPKLNFCMGN